MAQFPLFCMYGTVRIDPESLDWIGASTTDNVAAELSALAIAQNVVLRSSTHMRNCIRPDLSLSRLVADSITTTRSNPSLAQVRRAQGLWLAQCTQLLEVRGYTGHPWNELADALASFALKHGVDSHEHEFLALHQFVRTGHDVRW